MMLSSLAAAEAPRYEVTVIGGPESLPKLDPSRYRVKRARTLTDVRDELFGRARLLKWTRKMDQTDRELLWIRARWRPLSTLASVYPDVPRDRLETFQKLIRAELGWDTR